MADSEIVQQVIEVFSNGDVVKGKPQVMKSALEAGHANSRPAKHFKAMKKAALWFKSQPLVVKGAVVFVFSALVGMISVLLFKLMMLVSTCVFKKTPVHDDEKGELIFDVDEKSEKSMLQETMLEDAPLPNYQANGYAAVAKNDL